MSSRKKNVSTAAMPRQLPELHDWMAPLDVTAVCGPDLEYDPEFVVLTAKVATKNDAQYGDFVRLPEPVNWSDVERDCRRLMMRSKDMRLALLFTRCRTRLAGAAGLAEGTGLLGAWLTTFSDTLHPQPGVDADHDAALEIRLNALQALTDAEGLLSDVREIALTKSTAARLQVRDVERAFAHPRPTDALAPESVMRQLGDLRVQHPGILASFGKARVSLAAIDAWSREHLGEYTPDLSPLTRLLQHLNVPEDGSSVAHQEGAAIEPDCHDEIEQVASEARSSRQQESPELPPAISSGRQARGSLTDRYAARELIREARQWFEQHEPSSPIPLLLGRAEQFVGKPYAEVVRAIPAELLAQWSNGE